MQDASTLFFKDQDCEKDAQSNTKVVEFSNCSPTKYQLVVLYILLLLYIIFYS